MKALLYDLENMKDSSALSFSQRRAIQDTITYLRSVGTVLREARAAVTHMAQEASDRRRRLLAMLDELEKEAE